MTRRIPWLRQLGRGVVCLVVASAAALAQARAPAAPAAAGQPRNTPTPPIAGTATDPNTWGIARGGEFLQEVGALRDLAKGKAVGILAVHQRVREALTEVRRNPDSEAHRHALLGTALDAIGVVQSVVLEVRRQEAALDAAYGSDVERLRSEQVRRDKAAEASVVEAQAAEAELARVRERVAQKLKSGASDQELDEDYFAELALSERLASYATVARNHAAARTLPVRSLERLQAARRTCKEALIRFGGYSDRLAAATQTLEVVAEAFETRKLSVALGDLGDVTRNLVGDGALESTMQQVLAVLAQPELAATEPGSTYKATSFDEWKRSWQQRLAAEAADVVTTKARTGGAPAGGRK